MRELTGSKLNMVSGGQTMKEYPLIVLALHANSKALSQVTTHFPQD